MIYAGGAINSSITLAELGQQMAALDWQKNRQEIRFLLTGYYLDLYKLNNQLQVLQKNLDLTEQVIRNMESRRTQGTALKNDITRYELQKETLKLQLAKVQDACKIMNHQLVTTLHLPAGTEIIPDSTLLDERSEGSGGKRLATTGFAEQCRFAASTTGNEDEQTESQTGTLGTSSENSSRSR